MWIIPRSLNYAPGTEAWVSGSKEFSDLAATSLMWRSSLSLPRTWSLRWKREPWLRALSGRMLRPSQHESFTAWWISSQGGIPASHFQSPAKGLAPKIPATCGPGSVSSSTKSSPGMCSSRTWQATSRTDWILFGETFETWVTTLRRASSGRGKSALRTKGTDFSSWPTPSICGNYNRKGASPTSGDGLITVVNKAWPTVTARDWKSTGPRDWVLKDGTPKYHGSVVLPARVNGQPGQVQNNTNGSRPGPLNPEWVEALMGVPTGLTELGCWGTESSPPRQPSPSDLSWLG